MNKREMGEILALVWTEFPRRENKREQLDLWFMAFGSLPAPPVRAAVCRAMLTKPFEPKIADVAAELGEMRDKTAPADEAFGLLRRAVQRFGYYQQAAALASLPPEVASTAERLGWKEICLSDNVEALRAHFSKAYESLKNRHTKRLQLGEDLSAADSEKLLEQFGLDPKGIEA